MCTGGVVTLAKKNVSMPSVRMRNVRESVWVGCLRIFTNSDFAGNGVRLHALSQPNQAVRNDGHQVADGRSKKVAQAGAHNCSASDRPIKVVKSVSKVCSN